MTGALCAAASGVGFGVFQSLNRRAVAQMDVYVATFLQLVVASALLVVLALATEDLGALADASAASLLWFAGGGLVHFFVGWTLLNASQKRIGAARTSPLIATTPLFGVAVAFATLGETPGALAWVGIVVVTAGAFAVGLARAEGSARPRARDLAFGLGCACAWSISPVLIREGLKGLSSPLLGLAVGMVVSVAAFALLLAARRLAGAAGGGEPLLRSALSYKLAAGVFVALSTWGRWVAVDLTTIGVVLALGLMSVPVVLLLSPALMGRHVEVVNAQVWTGALLVVGGSLLLIARSL
jgi:drug/metabolite transporter (DMT)-like permease